MHFEAIKVDIGVDSFRGLFELGVDLGLGLSSAQVAAPHTNFHHQISSSH